MAQRMPACVVDVGTGCGGSLGGGVSAVVYSWQWREGRASEREFERERENLRARKRIRERARDRERVCV